MAYYDDIVLVGDSKVMCNQCKLHLPDDSISIDSHIISKEHIDSCVLRIMIQNNIVVSEYCAHCQICEETLCDLSVHIQSSKHKYHINAINEIIEKDGAFLELPQNTSTVSKVYCVICDRSMEFHFESIRVHISGDIHKRARAMAVQPFNGIFSVEGSNDDLWCKICQVYFENYIETIFEHVDKDKEHNVKLTKILRLIEGQNITIDTYLTNAAEDKATCHRCVTGVACNVDNLERHITGKRHKSTAK